MIRFACRCGQVVEVSDQMAGRSGVCLKCRAEFVFPQPSPAAVPLMQGVAGQTAGLASSSAPASRGNGHLPITALSGLALLIAFFLPWMRIQCMGQSVSEPTGLDLALDRKDSKMKDFQKDPTKSLDQSLKMPLPNGQRGPAIEDSPWGGTTPELFVFPLMGLAFAGWALLGLINSSADVRGGTKLILLLALAGIPVLAVEKWNDYRKPHLSDLREGWKAGLKQGAMKAGKPEDSITEAAAGMLTTDASVGFYISLISLAAIVLVHSYWLASRSSSVPSG